MSKMEMNPEAKSQEAREYRESPDETGATTSEIEREQREMDVGLEAGRDEAELAEQREMDDGEKLGYSSDYYEHEMASALKNGNRIAYNNAKSNWARAKAREETHS